MVCMTNHGWMGHHTLGFVTLNAHVRHMVEPAWELAVWRTIFVLVSLWWTTQWWMHRIDQMRALISCWMIFAWDFESDRINLSNRIFNILIEHLSLTYCSAICWLPNEISIQFKYMDESLHRIAMDAERLDQTFIFVNYMHYNRPWRTKCTIISYSWLGYWPFRRL